MLFRSYKGLSRGASRTVRTALRLAGQQGCATADTGHLLLAMLQTAQGPAADFLRRKRVTTASLTEAAPKRSGTGQPHRLRKNDLSAVSGVAHRKANGRCRFALAVAAVQMDQSAGFHAFPSMMS